MGSMSLLLQVVGMLGMLSLMHGAFAQSNTCNVVTLTPCLPYIEAGNTTKPASDCCNPLRSLLTSSDPTCLCQIAPLAKQSGFTINQTRALEVMSSCNQTVPSSITSCLSSILGAPLEAPSGSPTSSILAPQAGGNNNPNLGRTLLPPPFLVISSIFVSLSLYIAII